jgi:CHAD domain-containing protein
MNFRLHAHETVARGLLRIFRSELDNAKACAADDGRLTDKEIHNARKSVKRARATLRLLRPALPGESFETTNVALRDAARPLTHVRDAKVLLDALDDLRGHFGDVADNVFSEALEHALHSQRLRARRELASSANATSQMLEGLRGIDLRARRWKFSCDDWSLLRRGVNRVYRKARSAYATVCEARSDERLHEWRKQVKHLLHALEILTPLRPGRIGELADQAHKLAEYLGDDHDLAILRKQLDSQIFTGDEDEEAREQLEALIDKRRHDLQDRAFAVGKRLFKTKPTRLIKRLRRYWRAWQESSVSPVLEPEEAPRPTRRAPEAVARLH